MERRLFSHPSPTLALVPSFWGSLLTINFRGLLKLIAYLLDKLAKVNVPIRTLARNMDTATVRMVYFASAQSLLHYGLLFLGAASKSITIFPHEYCRLKTTTASVMQAGRRLFNSLPHNIRASNNKNVFKLGLTKHLLHHMYYNVNDVLL